jgi:hypothetical protein
MYKRLRGVVQKALSIGFLWCASGLCSRIVEHGVDYQDVMNYNNACAEIQ